MRDVIFQGPAQYKGEGSTVLNGMSKVNDPDLRDDLDPKSKWFRVLGFRPKMPPMHSPKGHSSTYF